MTDPTPEERAHEVVEKRGFRSLHDAIEAQIRAAVEAAIKKNNYGWEVEYVKGIEAETERCAKVDPLVVRCPTCAENQLRPCRDISFNTTRGFHSARWRAAIRK